MKKPPPLPAGSPPGFRRWGRSQDPHVNDAYKRRGKLPEATVCPQCGAVFHNGRWQWVARTADAHQELCQACHRINDRFPAGVTTLSGAFVGQHEAEILALARHQEELEKKEHALNRIMSIDKKANEIVISTTDIHLPRRIGEALKHAYHGTLNFHYDEQTYFIRVNWRRDK
jgi:hypothetical protein